MAIVSLPTPRPTRRAFTNSARAQRAWLLACALLCAGAVTAFAPAARAQPCPTRHACDAQLAAEAVTARGLALGTGLRASAISTSALAYSPAALALGNLYHIEANIDYISALNTVALGGAAVDSSTSKLGAGISLRGFLSGDDGYNNDAGYDYDGIDGRVGLALALSQAFSLGVSGRYINVSSERNPIDIEDGEDEDVDLVSGFTMDASLRIAPVEGLQLDIAAMNFIDRNSVLTPVTIAGGVAVSVADSFSFGMDVLADLSSFEHAQLILGGGGEYLAAGAVPLRLGYGYDLGRDVHVLGIGIGYTDTKVGVDVGVRQDLSGGDSTRVMAAVRYHVN